MYDVTCRFLAELYSGDFASWLLGTPVTLTEIQPSELSLEPIRADTVIFLHSNQEILHLEFQTQAKVELPFRMLDYRVRLHRRYPGKPVKQVVIYLESTRSSLVQQTHFSLELTHHQFEVIRLWEQPATLFLQYPGLVPFAILGQTLDLETTLRQVSQTVAQITDAPTQANILAATAILAGIKLDDSVVYRLLRKDVMQESVIYRSIKEEGAQEEQHRIALNLLRNGLSDEVVAQGTGLSLEQIKQLRQKIGSDQGH